ncbi:MAG: hypothetical protein ABI806_20125 [Candidatus Solibacter sp.]
MTSLRIRVRRWVMWWLAIGVVCGVVAVSIIVGDNLTPPQEKIVLLIGAAHWLLGGIVCWAFESVKVETRVETRDTPRVVQMPADKTPESYSHPASDFLLPGRGHSILPWRH